MAKLNEVVSTPSGEFISVKPEVSGTCAGCVGRNRIKVCETLPECMGVIFHNHTPIVGPQASLRENKGVGKPKLASEFLAKFPKACAAVADCSSFGAAKYNLPPGDMGYKEVPNPDIAYSDAAVRHITAYLSGQGMDSESGKPHLAHAAWSILAALESHLGE